MRTPAGKQVNVGKEMDLGKEMDVRREEAGIHAE
jgi:hypothetical protein